MSKQAIGKKRKPAVRQPGSFKILPPYLGAAWYPEDWPPAEWDHDISVMREVGCNVMRIGEFAWSRMEPREGRYDFEWLHDAVARLGRAGIATILGTPTPTPPLWLSEKHPEILRVSDAGRRRDAGHRLYYCPNNPLYRRHCARIAERMAREFGRDPRVIGWQIDNEVSGECFCPVCVRQFRAWIRRRYGSLAALNEAWGAGVWSHDYTAWTQLPVPQSGGRYDPTLRAAWMEFSSMSYADYVRNQVAALRRHATQPIGTDMMPYLGVDYHDMHLALDVVQYNHYNVTGNLWETAFWFDYCRCHKTHPFWNTETSTCWTNAHHGGVQAPGFCVANSWLPIALGAEANLYWLWRQHRSGREIYHGAVLNTAGRPLHVLDEVKETARGFRAAAELIRSTRPAAPGVALHLSFRTAWIRECQNALNERYLDLLRKHVHRPCMQAQLRMDVIPPALDLAPYRIVISPHLAALDEGGLRSRLKTRIEQGGIWIAGPCTDDLTIHGTKHTQAVYPSVEEWAGVRVRWQLPGWRHSESLTYALDCGTGRTTRGGLWYDGLELRGAEAIATYSEGPLRGLAAITRRKMGKGQVILLGTMPEADYFRSLMLDLAREAGIEPAAKASENIVAVPRRGESGEGLIVVEIEYRPGRIDLDRPMRDILTDRRLEGTVEVAPHQAMVLVPA